MTMSDAIHPTAVVGDGAELADGVQVGPYAVVGDGVQLGSGTVVLSHSVVEGPTVVGPGCRLGPFASVGSLAQVRSVETASAVGDGTGVGGGRLEVGRGCVVREFATLNRGTPEGGGLTQLGDGCLVMAYAHVAHDCRLGDRVVLSNGVALAGHVVVGDDAVLGGLSAVQQFTRVGRLAFLAGGAMVDRDVPPFVRVAGDRARLSGLNLVGLQRADLPEAHIKGLRHAYRALFRRRGQVVASVSAQLKDEMADLPEVLELLAFIAASERGICR
ncbi:MAG: acyl-ACP--UDP-N-acetylglucosamine O-acyltransferase [Myxococcota bacterium]